MNTQDQFQDERQDRLAEQIQQITNELQAVAIQDTPLLRERIFVGIFLPYFAGDEERAYPQANAAMWIDRVAGSPYKAVNVIDVQGQVLFTVPPLLDRSAVAPQAGSDRGPSIAHVVHSAQQYALMSPRQGAGYLQSELNKRALIMKVPANVLGHIEAWNKIFERYGRPPLMALEGEAEQASAAQSSPAAAAEILGGAGELL